MCRSPFLKKFVNYVRLKRLFFLVFIVHFVFSISIFDIFFKSTVVPNVIPVENNIEASASRVVLITVDGLRYDALFDKVSGQDVAPYIQQIIRERGSWGMSVTQSPTESRPGHVAMLAGFYEDPATITKLFQENPVYFDSIFNRSVCSLGWGSPDILEVFFKKLEHGCAYNESYDDEEFEGDTMKYDKVVYDNLISFFENSNNSVMLRQKKTFFFLHLLGQDISGHENKPHTAEYKQNLRNVDTIVTKIEELFNSFYGDNETSFVLTSDHGMTDWGIHGPDDRELIETPFVAWGAGIKRFQININQVDITPLLATLLGVPIPVNSIGVLPGLCLNTTEGNVAKAAFLNAQQITALLRKKASLVSEQRVRWLYRPFVSDTELDKMLKSISLHILNNQSVEAVQESQNLIKLCLKGLDYYHKYDQKSLLPSITLGHVGWVLYLVTELLEEKLIISKNLFTFTTPVMLTVIIIAVQNLPLQYYFYYLLPQLLWFLVLPKIRVLRQIFQKLKHNRNLITTGIVLIGIEIHVIAFFSRWMVSLSIGIIVLWTLSSLDIPQSNFIVTAIWVLSGVILSIFPFIPVSRKPNIFLILSSGILLFHISLRLSKCYFPREDPFLSASRWILIAASVLNSAYIHRYFNLHSKSLELNQCFSWWLFVLSFASLLFGSSNSTERLQQIFMGITVPYVLLSISHEGFFILTLFVHLWCWIHIESFDSSDTSDPEVSDFRRAYFILSYISIGFFGVGNISTVNAFASVRVRCFSVTSELVGRFLFTCKYLIPFLAVASAARVLTVSVDLKPRRLFIIFLIYCNVMGLNFLYLIKNKGSWYDMGTSVWHYVIQQVATVVLVLLYVISKFLMSAPLYVS